MFKGKNVLTEDFIRSRVLVDGNGCWLWTKPIQSAGYGYFKIGNKNKLAHRASWELFNDSKIPNNLCVCHKCDVRRCVNPEHLFLGTHKDNMDDAQSKGRLYVQKGDFAFTRKKRKRKLTDEQVREIRWTRYKEPLEDTAARYGVSLAHVSMIRRGKRKGMVTE